MASRKAVFPELFSPIRTVVSSRSTVRSLMQRKLRILTVVSLIR